MKDQRNKVTIDQNGGECLKTAVIEILQCTEMEYCQFQMKEGESYLNSYIQLPAQYSKVIDCILKNRIFWNWWKNHWALRDQKFLKLSVVTECKDVKILRKRYIRINSAKRLTTCIHPNRVVLEQSYADMIHEAVKQEVRKS